MQNQIGKLVAQNKCNDLEDLALRFAKPDNKTVEQLLGLPEGNENYVGVKTFLKGYGIEFNLKNPLASLRLAISKGYPFALKVKRDGEDIVWELMPVSGGKNTDAWQAHLL